MIMLGRSADSGYGSPIASKGNIDSHFPPAFYVLKPVNRLDTEGLK